MQAIFDLAKSIWWVWILLVLVFIYRLFKPKIKGIIGEKSISAILSTLPLDKYIILNNILLKTETATTQIDHIVVSVYGVFVIETKNYTGWILGKEKDEYWTQSIYGKKNRFKNPIRQNYGHIKTLEGLLTEYSDLPIKSIIAFSPECELKVHSENIPVLYFLQVAKFIRKISINEVITFEKANEIAQKIKTAHISDKGAMKQHVESIHETMNETKAKIEQGICPKCGGTLVERSGKYGKFIGCSNYPKCRFIVK